MLSRIETPSRRVRVLRIVAVVLFVALLALGPLTEHTWPEKGFTATLVLLTALMVLFATGRTAFALLVAALGFGAIEIAGTLKFTYLTTPLLAPDLEYFVNRDTIGVIARYPFLLGATLTAVILIPALLLVAFFGEPPSLLRDRPRAVRGIVRVLGMLAAAASVPSTRTIPRTARERSRSSDGGSPKNATSRSNGIRMTAVSVAPSRNG